MYGQPGQRLAAGPGDDRMVASHGAQVNAAGWVNLGVFCGRGLEVPVKTRVMP